MKWRRLVRWFKQSLRRRLLLWLLPATFLAGLLASLGTYWGAADQLNDLLSDQMRYIAEHVEVGNDGSVSFQYPKKQHEKSISSDLADEVLLQVWLNGKLEYTTDSGLLLPKPQQSGFLNVQLSGQTWHTFTMKRGKRWIVVGQARDARWEALAGVAVHLFWPVLSLLPVLALFLWFGIGHGLKPLRLISVELAQRNANSMEPIDTHLLPGEIHPFAHALNDLLLRLEYSFKVQKDFIADAAHELRTPIMGLAIQTELLQRSDDPKARQQTIEQLQIGIDRLSHITAQLLALARLDPNAAMVLQSIELPDLCQSVMSEHNQLAEARQIKLSCAGRQPIAIIGDYDSLRILLNNLLDNAIRYSHVGGSVELSTRITPQGVLLTVCDDGPGIPEEERIRVMERFYRGSSARDTGSGLGLSIVKRIAERHFAQVSLHSGHHGQGLKVHVQFPVSALIPSPKSD
ncbi:ATP-binding protein [Celerinatantimonas yamalensis]|uniref:histidine kinase n=1 Tax=Celerinatantimonas yamalensis TaxID=559956 RepID=A0ABW9G8H0_9GAMM